MKCLSLKTGFYQTDKCDMGFLLFYGFVLFIYIKFSISVGYISHVM